MLDETLVKQKICIYSQPYNQPCIIILLFVSADLRGGGTLDEALRTSVWEATVVGTEGGGGGEKVDFNKYQGDLSEEKCN